MNKVQRSKLDALDRVIEHLEENNSIIATIPMLVIILAALKETREEIAAAEGVITQALKGVRDQKDAERENLIGLAVMTAGVITCYASLNNDTLLREQMHFTRSGLSEMKDLEVAMCCDIIYEKGVELAPKLIPFGITNMLLEEFGSSLKEYTRLKGSPRGAVAEIRDAVIRIPELLKKAITILKEQTDPLVWLFRKTEISFYQQYWMKRKYVDPYTRHTAIKGEITNKATGEPMHNVLVEMLTTDLNTVSNENGVYKLRTPMYGITVELLFTCEGFKPLRLSVKTKKGKAVKLDAVMEAL